MPKLSEGSIAIGALILFAAWLFIGLPWIFYPSEHIQYVVVDSTHAQNTDAEPKGSAKSPFFVQVMPGSDAAQKRAEEAEDREEKKESDRALVRWTKALAFATIGLILATCVLGIFAWRQSRDTQDSISVARKSAEAAEMQAAIMASVEGPIPVVAALKLAEYANIPGETIITDPVPPGPLRPNCRILFAIENKGRSPLRMKEICIEKHIGTALPDIPTYTHKNDWGLVLEKGPLWIRATDNQIEVTPSDLGAAYAVYPSGGALWVYGYFAYLNLLNERVEHKFLAGWDLKDGFIPDNRPGYT